MALKQFNAHIIALHWKKIAVVIFRTILRSTVQLLIGNYLVCLGRLYNYCPVFLMV